MKNGVSDTLSTGRWAIFYCPIFPCKLRKVTPLKIIFFVWELVYCFFPPFVTFSWHHLIIKSVLALFFGNSIGWMTSSFGLLCLICYQHAIFLPCQWMDPKNWFYYLPLSFDILHLTFWYLAAFWLLPSQLAIICHP